MSTCPVPVRGLTQERHDHQPPPITVAVASQWGAPPSELACLLPVSIALSWGGVTGSGNIDRPLIRGMTTGLFAGREALRDVDGAIGAVGRPGDGDDRRTHVIDISGTGAFLGLDFGKGEHHTTAVTPARKRAFDKRPPHSEPKLREVFGKLQAKHGTVLVVVDQPASIDALPPAVARTWAARWPICRG